MLLDSLPNMSSHILTDYAWISKWGVISHNMKNKARQVVKCKNQHFSSLYLKLTDKGMIIMR